ncbi:hypothetical protein [Legionella sp.]|uniref:hypothetical protein n=1 Tax=Legionella sp. TaxID=459 RepID=UPI003C89F0F2
MKSKIETPKENEAKSPRELELEEIHGAAALKWVAQQNEEIKSTFWSSPSFKEMEKTLLSFYEDQRKVPYISMDNSHYYNFWCDEHHIQGIWRRTTLEEYRKPNTQWELLLDIDALPEEEAWLILTDTKVKAEENWVFHSVLKSPNGKRGLVALSLGGKDASVVREFDIDQKKFITDGFTLPENKSCYAWCDNNSIWVGTNFGEGSLTESGYSRIAKLWQRGESLEHATTIFEGQSTDVEIEAITFHGAERNYHYIKRSINFYEHEYFMINEDLSLSRLPVPLSVNLEDFISDQVIISLYKDWEAETGHHYKTGSVIALDLSSIQDPKQLKISLIFEPTDSCFMSSVCTTKNDILLTLTKNVCNEIHRFNISCIHIIKWNKFRFEG